MALVENLESRLNAATADSVIFKDDAVDIIRAEQDINVAKAEAIGIATVLGADTIIADIKAATTVEAVADAVNGVETGWTTAIQTEASEDDEDAAIGGVGTP